MMSYFHRIGREVRCIAIGGFKSKVGKPLTYTVLDTITQQKEVRTDRDMLSAMQTREEFMFSQSMQI